MRLTVADADFYANEHGVRFRRVTRLLQKHGLGTPLDGIPKKTLQRAADKGTMIHKEFQDCIENDGMHMGISSEVEFFAREIYPMFDSWESEQTVYTIGLPTDYAGTIDLIGFKDGVPKAIVDIKTGAVHVGYVSKQTTLYRKAYCQMYHLNPEDIELWCIDAKEEGCRMIPLNPWPDREVMQLLKCEANGELYTPAKPMVSAAEDRKIAAYEEQIARIKAQLEKKQTEYEAFKQKLAAHICEYGEIGYRNDQYSVALIAPSVRYDFDSKAFAVKHPDLYEAYKTKLVSVKGQVKVTKLKKKEADSEAV